MKTLRIATGILVMVSPVIAMLLLPLWEDIFKFDFIGWAYEMSEELFGKWSATMDTLIIITILSIFVIVGFIIVTYPWKTRGEEMK